MCNGPKGVNGSPGFEPRSVFLLADIFLLYDLTLPFFINVFPVKIWPSDFFLITYGQNGQPNYYLEVQNTNIYVAGKWQGFYLK